MAILRSLLFAALAGAALAGAAIKPNPRASIKRHQKQVAGKAKPARNSTKGFGGLMNGVLTFTRFNCAFPFCPTTALDVCSADEHYELGRPHVLATLIEQTPTDQMNFFAYSDFDNSTRLHYTLAARQVNNNALNQLFTVYIAMNGTSGYLQNSVEVSFPANVQQSDITYFFTYNGNVYISFSTGLLLTVNPLSGAVLNSTTLVPADGSLTDTLASAFDQTTGTFYVNALGAAVGNETYTFYLHSYNVNNGASTKLGPLPPAPGTADPSGNRADNAISSMVVYPPASVGGGVRLMELRNSNYDPFLWASWLDVETGNSSLIPMPEDWYLNWEIDPQIFTDQWPGSQRRVWTYDPQNNVAWFKMYDECGGESDDCDEDETVVYLQWVPPSYVDFYVAVEPIEPEMTQMIWTWTNIVEEKQKA